MKVKVWRDVGIDVAREVEEKGQDEKGADIMVKRTVTDHFKYGETVDVPDDQAAEMIDKGHVEPVEDKE